MLEKNLTHKKSPVSFDNTENAFAHFSNWDLRRAYWLFRIINSNSLVNIGTLLTEKALNWHLPIAPLIKSTIFHQFCGGETLEQTLIVTKKLAEYNVKSLLDYGVEAKETEPDFDETLKNLCKAIDFAKKEAFIPVIPCKISGLARNFLLEKVSSGENFDRNRTSGMAAGKRPCLSIMYDCPSLSYRNLF